MKNYFFLRTFIAPVMFLMASNGSNAQIRLLPLHKFELKASLQNATVSLDWISENEMNSTQYVVERSKDGIHFEVIGKKPAEGPINTPTHFKYPDDLSSSNGTSVV